MSCSKTKACGREEIPPPRTQGPCLDTAVYILTPECDDYVTFHKDFIFSLSSHIILRATITWLQMSWNHQGDKWVSGGGRHRPCPCLCRTTHLCLSSTFLAGQCVPDLPSLCPLRPLPSQPPALKAIENGEHLTLENIPYFTEFGKWGERFGIFFWLLARVWFIKLPLRQLLTRFIFSVSQVCPWSGAAHGQLSGQLVLWTET